MKRRLPWIIAVMMVLGTGALRLPRPPDPEPTNGYGALGLAKLKQQYRSWVREHEAEGGDHRVRVGLAYNKGLSQEFSDASGSAELDLIGGNVSARIEGLPPGEFELWLVDNRPGPGTSVRPEASDVQLRVGALRRDGARAELQAQLGARAVAQLSPDLVVVTRRGSAPQQGLLFGSTSLFQRLYTTLRSPALLAASELRPPGRELAFGAALAAASDPPENTLVDSDVALSSLIATGADLFINQTFAGNGRTCATCHPFASNTQLNRSDIAALPDSDPLFQAEFSGPLAFVASGPKFEVPALMRGNALILENQDGFGDLKNRFNMRGIPHTLALSTSLAPVAGNGDLAPFTSFPAQRTGWSGDGAPGGGALRDFATGAVTQHFTKTLARQAGVDFRLPTDPELDAMEAFQLSLGRSAPINLASMPFRNPIVKRGRDLFLDPTKRCNGCHNNAGATVAAGGNRNFDTGVELQLDRPTETILAALGLDLTPDFPNLVPRDGGFGATGSPSAVPPGSGTGDPVTGFGNGTFNVPPLVEAADTAPFFHDNSVSTLEAAVTFYSTDAFKNSPAGGGNAVNLQATQIQAIASMLRALNALENIREARELASTVSDLPPNQRNSLGRQLLRQAGAEIEDAVRVLSAADLHPTAVTELDAAFDLLDRKNNPPTQPGKIADVIQLLDDARADILVI